MTKRASTPSLLLPPPVRRLREHLRDIRGQVGETQGELHEFRRTLSEQLAELEALAREQVIARARIEARLEELGRPTDRSEPSG